MNKGYVIIPFTSPPLSPFHVNSIGISTHKYSGKKWLNVYMSSISLICPHSNIVVSLNECIPLEPFSFHYASVDITIQLIMLTGDREKP